MAGLLRGGAGALGVTLGAAGVVAGTRSLAQNAIALERSSNALRFGSDGPQDFNRNLEFVRKNVRELGLELISTQSAFAKFMAAGKGTAFSGDELRSVFQSVAQASAVLGLSADDTAGTLNALQQMISKGTVQAEELRGQLGERLPGAFNMAARAMGVTTQELGKMMERGELTAYQLLPALAVELDKAFGPSSAAAAKSLNSEINRLSNAWSGFKSALFAAGIETIFRKIVEAVRESLELTTELLNAFKKFELTGDPLNWRAIATQDALSGARKIGGVEYTRAARTPFEQFRAGLADVPALNEAEMKDARTKLVGTMDRWRVIGRETSSALSDGFTDFFSNIQDGAQSASKAFRSMASSMLSDIGRIIARRAIAEPLAAGIMSFAGLAGGVATVKHAGGIVGVGSTSRFVDPGMFVGAPRLHSGLAPDEFPTILQRGEEVIPKGQAGRRGESVNITVNVDGSKGGTPEQNSRMGAEIARQIDQMIDARIARAAGPRGILRRA
jgi:tape measure domain-containing protein